MLIYIKPLSVFPELHSDRLFGAIFSAISELYPEKLNEIIENFEDNNPPFIISSTFPAIKIGDETILNDIRMDEENFKFKIRDKDRIIEDRVVIRTYEFFEINQLYDGFTK